MEGWPEREGDSADLVAASPYEPEGSPPSNGGNARESNPPSAVKRNNGFEDRGGHRTSSAPRKTILCKTCPLLEIC